MAEAQRPDLILASASPFRRKLLEDAGLSLKVVPADVDEASLKRDLAGAPPSSVAEALARAKAMIVAASHPRAYVIGSDQVLALDGVLFDKPRDLQEVRAHLERLRGRRHQLFTAVALAHGGDVVWSRVETASLTMRSFSPQFLDNYIARTGDVLCRIVGAYEIEGPGLQLFERIEGDHSTIIGLPMLPLLAELRMRGVIAS